MKPEILPRYNPNISERWFEETKKVIDMLAFAVPNCLSERREGAFAGSTALFLLQEEKRIGPKWHDEPGDYDYFIAGKFARTAGAFLQLVDRVIEMLRAFGALVDEVERYRVYGRENLQFWVIDLQIRGVASNVSFIQARGCRNVFEAVGKFDINVCRVIYDVHEKKLMCSPEVEKDIEHHVATVDGIAFVSSKINKMSMKYVTRIMKRVVKYSDRGYHFINMQGVRFVRVPPGTRKVHAKRNRFS